MLTKGMEKKASANPGQRRPSSAVTGPNTQTQVMLTALTKEKGMGQVWASGWPMFLHISPRKGIGRALQVDAVLLELVDQVGQHAQPGEPDEVSPARHGEVAAQGVGAEQQGEEQGRAEAHVGPHIAEGEHRWRLALPDQIFIRESTAASAIGLAPFLHEVTALGDLDRRRAVAEMSAHRRARITGGPSTGSFMPIAIRLLPAQRSRQKRLASRDSAALAGIGLVRHQIGETPNARLVRGIRERARHRPLPRPPVRCGQARFMRPAMSSVGVAIGEGAPVEEALRQRRVAGAQGRVHDQQRRKALGIGHRQGEPDQAAPVPHHQHDVPEVERRDQAEQRVAMEVEGVDRLVRGLVGAAEAREVGRHDPVSGSGEDRDHAPVEVAPGRLAMQAEEGLARRAAPRRHGARRSPSGRSKLARRIGPIGQVGESVHQVCAGRRSNGVSSGHDRPLETRPAEGRSQRTAGCRLAGKPQAS